MRRIVLAVVSTVAALVLLFSYRTSLPQSVAISTASGAAHVVSRPATSGAKTSASVTTGAPATTGQPADDGAVTVPTTSDAASSSGKTTAAKSTTASSTAAKATAAKSTTAQSTTSKASAPVVVDGASTDTQFGPVQVEVTITAGKITAVTAIVYPNENPRDQEINSYAIPQLQQQAVAAQSATIDGVGGATYTTEGFQTSLQSALDAAHFAG